MPTKDKRSSDKIYQGDVVQLTSSPRKYATVVRCWYDAEDDAPPEDNFPDPYFRPLKDGEFVVVLASDHSKRDIVTEPKIHLVDRVLRLGDFCKRAHDDVRSGVVLDARVRARLAHVISGEEVQGWKTMDDVEERTCLELGDYVAYDDWVGQVFEIFDEALVQLQSSGQIVKLPEMGSRLFIGDRGPDIVPPPVYSNFTSMLNSVFGNHSTGDATVIDVKHTVYAIGWLALNQSLDPSLLENRQRPKPFWMGTDIGELTLLRTPSDAQMHCGDHVRLKNTSPIPVTAHGQEGVGPGIITVDMCVVLETETQVDVLWQDGTKETVSAKDVIPYMPDEYDCWPGDHVMWKNEDQTRPAIVQSVDATRRTATVLLPDTNSNELVSLLELDPQGTSDTSPLGPDRPPDGLGAHRGELVLIHGHGRTNGYTKPWVPKIGELEPWIRELSLDNGGWRKDLCDLGTELMRKKETQAVEERKPKIPTRGTGTCLWFGEVNLDGTVVVKHCDRTTNVYPLEQLTRLFDGLEQLEMTGFSADDHDHNEHDEYEDETWAMEDGAWHATTTSVLEEGDWVDDDSMDVDTIVPNSSGTPDSDGMKVDNPDSGIISPSSPSQHPVCSGLTEEAAITNNSIPYGVGAATHILHSPQSMNPSPARPLPQTDPLPSIQPNPSTTLDKTAGATGVSVAKDELGLSEDGATKGLTWKRFDVLPSAPPDHAFYSKPPAQPGRAFLGRVLKLAHVCIFVDTIIVRAYEDRLDLLRSLIIGPENTPYEDAPFVIDWMLDSNFPNSPPVAHFLSWTNGNGRVNPNLYEEGKVCLSILGTWAGDRTEIWSAARSSLLQAFISIQGLVLVKEPWFCEPGYEKLRGTEEGIINSRLYSEKAYVLSRGFIRRALELSPGSLESELTWLYYTQGRLQKVLNDSRTLVDKSRKNPNPSKEELEMDCTMDIAVPRLTVGGIITLERTLGKLQGLLDGYLLKN
ncbi:hypothetical protein AGABI2DRAFT_114397 [Agaricus bisporus var. bisporus H97]|uniref:hypothetical protein n=1 Tax=Agaricus bisporus var. bisporus (strain H97 / ATCC MYA-4626 / FGSC 10389) TaxID=936046 RepID=UPI00029F62AE|nr:hypothetical protein AGABI2DRAFT_114397 [Agaricus bisporus var. bisporus H97]EKV51677.1 hypothetical protein AGABI2DRAFT_114397 [Agaricus bisporus var. bisporus H97]